MINDLLITLGVIITEIFSLNIAKYIEVIVTVAIVTYISRKAEKTIYRLILSLVGIHFFTAHIGHTHFLFAFDVSVGLSLLIPHIVYWIDYTKRFIQRTIEISTNFFFFMLTIYYKLRKFVLWFYEIYLKVRNFFAKKKYEKAKKDYESKQNKKEEKDNKNNYYEKQEYSSNYKSDEKSKNRNNENDSNEENNQSSSSSNNYESSSTQNSNSNNNPYGKEFNQFFSSSYYTRLGVSTSDDKATIKKAYRKLVMKYHPDVNLHDEYEKYNHICQLINEANEYLMK